MTKSTLASSPGWNTIPPPKSTQSVAPLIVRPTYGKRGQEEEHDRRDAEDVLDGVQRPVVTEEEDERGEGGDADHDPEPLPERELRVDPVDHREPERGEKAAEREQERVGVGERSRRTACATTKSDMKKSA